MTWIVLGVVAVLAIFIVNVYNSLIQLKNKVDEGWADIDTQLKRRYDLIPNMVEIVKGYAKHESKTLEAVIQARSVAMNANTPEEKVQAENALTGTLKTLFAVAESYPDLKANQNFLDLQATLKEVEEKLQLSRRYYNATVRDFNTKIEIFPNNIVAGMFKFDRRKFFEIEEEQRQNVKVSFDDEKPAAKEEVKTPEVK
jgi:LemA protein